MKTVALLFVLGFLTACGQGFTVDGSGQGGEGFSENASVGAPTILVIKNVSVNQKIVNPIIEVKATGASYSVQ